MKRVTAILLLIVCAWPASAANYAFDTPGMHAFIHFRVKHLGFSWLYGQFRSFEGKFAFDPADPASSSVHVEIDMSSLDSNHAERDKHLRSDDYLDVDEYPTARFVSKRIEVTGDTSASVIGDFTLHGTTREISLDVRHIGGGPDPWGGERQGFEGSVAIQPADYGIEMAHLGQASATVEIILSIEGVRR